MTDLPPGFAISSRTVALRVAHELRLLKHRLHVIEVALDGLLERDDLALGGDTVGDLQQMDVVHQAVEALSDYLESIAPRLCAEDRVDGREPLSRVRLKAVADRLAGQEGAPEVADSDLTLF